MKDVAIPFGTAIVVTGGTLIGVHHLSKGMSKPLYAFSMCAGLVVGYVISDIIAKVMS